MAICLKVAKEQKHWSRHNGWSLPLHPLQVSAWFFLVMFAFLYFGVLVPNMPDGAWQISAYLINGSVFIFHIIIHLISVSLNPADINVRAKASKGPLPSFDRSKHSHVIENEYCHICEVKVGRRSKHCSACNKCVSEFDHHCKWLNNCVGGRNYRLFISCVTSALLGSLIIFISSVVMIVAYFEGRPWLFRTKYLDITVPSTPFSTDNNMTEFPILYSTAESLIFQNITFSNWGTQKILCAQVHGTLWICIVFITAALSLLAIALLGHLLGFHIFLMCQNFASTYDYIVHKRDQPANKRPETKRKNSDLDCHFHVLQHLKTKKGNQISPKTQENGKGDDIEEWELQANISHSNTRPEPKKPTMPLVTENKCAASTEEEDCPLEHYVGHVYIGSPHRRRHYLEPINIHQKSSSPKNKPGKKEESPLKKRTSDKEENDEKDDSLTDNDSQSSGSSSSLSQVFGHGGVPRRLHRTPSPAPLLSPILESEMTSGSAIVSWKHRSVSEQSLHTLDENEEDVTAVPTTCTVEIESSLSQGSQENSGSLSNLFLSKDELEEDKEEEDNNNVIIDDDNRVHEVCIIPQKDLESNCNNKIEVIENADPVVNGEGWAYTSRNGCQIKDIVSFKRSCSMQDNERIKNLSSGGVSDPLTRCCSEDELKSVQRMTQLQRRLSEDRDLWMLRGGCSNIPQTWREHSPKAGVSATAVFCVDEPEESFRIPGIPFGIKRKYNHFSVPNHIVLPCSNSVHPESRKRTRPVGSKPPKAFHA